MVPTLLAASFLQAPQPDVRNVLGKYASPSLPASRGEVTQHLVLIVYQCTEEMWPYYDWVLICASMDVPSQDIAPVASCPVLAC